MSSFEYFYGDYGDVEEAFLAELDKSLQPRGPDMLYDVVAGLGLQPVATVLDLGCGDGAYGRELHRRFGYAVVGVDPYQVAPESAGFAFRRGRAEAIPADDAMFDLIWCRDVLVHSEDLDRVFAECRRVLRPGARMLILHPLATERMAPREAAWLWPTMHVVPATADAVVFDSAWARAGFVVQQSFDIRSEWREYREESTGQSRLLHAARLLREPERYIRQFGQQAYEIMLGDCYWHIYQLLGKFTYRVYVLRNA
jgi:SAM-dependent methyltransferase